MPTIFAPKKETLKAHHPNPKAKVEKPIKEVAQVKEVLPVKEAAPVHTVHETGTNNLNLFTNYCMNPQNVELYGQDKDERVLLFLRRDFITNVPWIIKAVFFLILPFLIMPLLEISNLSLSLVPLKINILILSFYYLIVAGYLLASFTTWFYTIGIITSKKAVDIDFHNLSSIHVGTVNLPDTSDAKYLQQGFFQSFFDYGDITITVEATKEKFVFEKTPRPAELSDFLSDLIGEA